MQNGIASNATLSAKCTAHDCMGDDRRSRPSASASVSAIPGRDRRSPCGVLGQRRDVGHHLRCVGARSERSPRTSGLLTGCNPSAGLRCESLRGLRPDLDIPRRLAFASGRRRAPLRNRHSNFGPHLARSSGSRSTADDDNHFRRAFELAVDDMGIRADAIRILWKWWNGQPHVDEKLLLESLNGLWLRGEGDSEETGGLSGLGAAPGKSRAALRKRERVIRRFPRARSTAASNDSPSR